MKRFIYILSALALAILLLLSSCRTNEAFFGYEDDGQGGYILSTYIGTDINLTVPEVHDGKPVTEIAKSAFFSNQTLRSVTIGANIKSIGEDAFAYCKYLNKVKFEGDVEIIGESSFEGCSLLKKVSFSDKLKTIDDMAFKGCTNLRRIYFPESIDSIGYQAFAGCESLIMDCADCQAAKEYAEENSVATDFSQSNAYDWVRIPLLLAAILAIIVAIPKIIKLIRRKHKNGKTG